MYKRFIIQDIITFTVVSVGLYFSLSTAATPLFSILFCSLFSMLCKATVYLSVGACPSLSSKVDVARDGGGGTGATGGRGGGATISDDSASGTF